VDFSINGNVYFSDIVDPLYFANCVQIDLNVILIANDSSIANELLSALIRACDLEEITIITREDQSTSYRSSEILLKLKS